ncbi:MAG: DUF1858 domain-containing protein, partial [Clostridia bacterium]|nr:DUF1858 domain-containing protein [Clostridia bacterium]
MEVTYETIIGDIVDFDEDTADIFLECGMHCIDCPVSRMETVEEACMVHGVDPDELIEKLNEYCRGYGLGQPTGIEYPEATGVLAGPDYVETSGLGSWGPGDTLQAAI